MKRNKAVVGLEKDHHGAVHKDNICLFRCVALHLGREAAELYAECSDEDVHDFIGVTLDYLYRVACISLSRPPEETTTAELVRRSLCH